MGVLIVLTAWYVEASNKQHQDGRVGVSVMHRSSKSYLERFYLVFDPLSMRSAPPLR